MYIGSETSHSIHPKGKVELATFFKLSYSLRTHGRVNEGFHLLRAEGPSPHHLQVSINAQNRGDSGNKVQV